MRDTYQEILRPKSVLDSYCLLHRGSTMPQDLVVKPQIEETQIIASSNGFTAEPVHMTRPTVIGEDPYNAVRPAPLKAVPVQDDGTPVLRATPVVDEEPAGPSLKIAPPPKLKIE